MQYQFVKFAFTLICVLALNACEPDQSQTEPPVAESGIAAGIWRVTLQTAGGELPFLLELQQSADGWRAWYLNGEERMPVEQVAVANQTLTLIMPTLDSRLT